MKTLFLLRHAKAENPEAGQADLNRALNERGRNEARAIGRFIKRRIVQLDLVLCSTATRARETTELVLTAAELTAPVRYDHRIYENGPLRLLEVIAKIEENRSTLLVVGHNPGMAELIHLLTDRVEQMAPGTLTKIDVNTDGWSSVQNGKATLDWIVKPKELTAN